MEGIPQNRPESQESYNERVGQITLFRHGDTTYTNQYPDLTDEGKLKLEAAGKSLKERVNEGSEDLIFLHSPSTRAKASMAHLLHGMERTSGVEEGDVEEIARSFSPLRSVEKLNAEESQRMVDEHMAGMSDDEKYEGFDRVYALHDDFEISPHWEARSKVEARANRLLRQTIAMLVKNHSEDTAKTPHIVAISHFETLNNLAVNIFGLDVEKDPLYARGEEMTFEVKGNSKDKTKVLLQCGFRSEHKQVWFSIESGEMTPIS
jgi:broad specificity phosphatase PhoE